MYSSQSVPYAPSAFAQQRPSSMGSTRENRTLQLRYGRNSLCTVRTSNIARPILRSTRTPSIGSPYRFLQLCWPLPTRPQMSSDSLDWPNGRDPGTPANPTSIRHGNIYDSSAEKSIVKLSKNMAINNAMRQINLSSHYIFVLIIRPKLPMLAH